MSFKIRYPINQRSPRVTNTRYRVGGTGVVLPGGYNQKSVPRLANKPKKQKPKKDVEKKTADGEDEEETEKKTILKEEDVKGEETNENG